METILHTQKYRFLKFYDNGDYSFKEGEEGLFRLSPDQIQLILSKFLTKKRV